jgi:hypothetical protein
MSRLLQFLEYAVCFPLFFSLVEEAKLMSHLQKYLIDREKRTVLTKKPVIIQGVEIIADFVIHVSNYTCTGSCQSS